MNKVILTGNLCKDIELKQTATGVSVLQNTVATKRDFKENGEYITDFINIVVWRQQAEYLNSYAAKGDLVELIGRWQVRKYTDQNGNNREANECVVDNIKILKSSKQDPAEPVLDESIDEGDLPF